jgi:hypothetical protein
VHVDVVADGIGRGVPVISVVADRAACDRKVW